MANPVQVCANYDFDAQPGSGELTIRAGDILTVIRRVANQYFVKNNSFL